MVQRHHGQQQRARVIGRHAHHLAHVLRLVTNGGAGHDGARGGEALQRALRLAQEMRARHDLLAGIAAFLHAVGGQPIQCQLLRRPLLALGSRQAGQAVAQVRHLPCETCSLVVRRRGADPQRARTAIAPHVQFNGIARRTQQVALRVRRRGVGAADGPVRGDFDLQLSSKHETPQRFGEQVGGVVGQHQPHAVLGRPGQREHRDHAPFGRQPRVPLPASRRQRGDIVGELGVGESHGIRAFQRHQRMVGQAENRRSGRGKVVSQGGED